MGRIIYEALNCVYGDTFTESAFDAMKKLMKAMKDLSGKVVGSDIFQYMKWIALAMVLVWFIYEMIRLASDKNFTAELFAGAAAKFILTLVLVTASGTIIPGIMSAGVKICETTEDIFVVSDLPVEITWFEDFRGEGVDATTFPEPDEELEVSTYLNATGILRYLPGYTAASGIIGWIEDHFNINADDSGLELPTGVKLHYTFVNLLNSIFFSGADPQDILSGGFDNWLTKNNSIIGNFVSFLSGVSNMLDPANYMLSMYYIVISLCVMIPGWILKIAVWFYIAKYCLQFMTAVVMAPVGIAQSYMGNEDGLRYIRYFISQAATFTIVIIMLRCSSYLCAYMMNASGITDVTLDNIVSLFNFKSMAEVMAIKFMAIGGLKNADRLAEKILNV